MRCGAGEDELKDGLGRRRMLRPHCNPVLLLPLHSQNVFVVLALVPGEGVSRRGKSLRHLLRRGEAVLVFSVLLSKGQYAVGLTLSKAKEWLGGLEEFRGGVVDSGEHIE